MEVLLRLAIRAWRNHPQLLEDRRRIVEDPPTVVHQHCDGWDMHSVTGTPMVLGPVEEAVVVDRRHLPHRQSSFSAR